MILDYLYCIFSKALAFLLVVHAANEEELTVSLYKVLKDGALIDWHFTPEHRHLNYCDFTYGAVSDKEHEQKFRLNISDKRTVDLSNLHFNVTYYCYMVCYAEENSAFTSNTIRFTTEQEESFHDGVSPNLHKTSPVYSDNPIPVSLDIEWMRSSNIILGAICGIIGFLIINVTVVLAIRKYSYWHIRRRRILETEDREYDGLDYLRDEE